jgi:nicotinamide riboside kinase
MSAPIQRIGLIGAESSGKTTLAEALAHTLNASGTPAVVVPEYLRTWCGIHDRLPASSDQADILAGQLEYEDRAAEKNPGAILVCDPAAVTTSLYSVLYFQDESLIDLKLLDRYQQLLWCNIDIAWVPDPLRDGGNHRRMMHDLISDFLPEFESTWGSSIPLISGSVADRITQAWQPNLPINSP